MTDDRAALEELAIRLWDERRSLTFLLYKLTASRLLLAADEQRFAPDALEEVDGAVELLRDGELRRNEAVRELAELWRVSPDEVSLPALAAEAPAPFDHTFAEHLVAFRRLAAEIESVSREDRALARAQLDQLTDSIGRLTARGPTTSTRGSSTSPGTTSGHSRPRPVSCPGENLLRPSDVPGGERRELSGLEDVDVAQEMMELQIQQIGYQATIHSLRRALPPSLVSFLR